MIEVSQTELAETRSQVAKRTVGPLLGTVIFDFKRLSIGEQMERARGSSCNVHDFRDPPALLDTALLFLERKHLVDLTFEQLARIDPRREQGIIEQLTKAKKLGARL